MLEIKLINRDTNEESQLSFDKQSLIIGRLPGTDIHLDAASVSRKHAELVKIRGHYYIVDLESGNGTFYNGARLKPNEKQIIHTGDSIRIENFEILPTLDSAEKNPEEQTDSGIIEIKMIKKVLGALDTEKSPSLEGISPPIEGKITYFTDSVPELVIGRDSACLYSIESGAISRRHAVIQKKWGGITLTDLESKNGTFVNGVKIKEKELHDGDRIAFGDVEVMFRNPAELDLDALTKEYEKKSVQEQLPEAGQDEVPTGLIDSQTGLNTKKPSTTEKDNPSQNMISDAAKLSVGVEETATKPPVSAPVNGQHEESAPEFESSNDATPERKLIFLSDSFKKLQLLKDHLLTNLKPFKDYLDNLLADFTPVERAILWAIVALVFLAIVSFIIIFA